MRNSGVVAFHLFDLCAWVRRSNGMTTSRDGHGTVTLRPWAHSLGRSLAVDDLLHDPLAVGVNNATVKQSCPVIVIA